MKKNTISLSLLFAFSFFVSTCKKEKVDNTVVETTQAGANNGTVQNFVATINGKTYKTVVIGTQTWMAENLNDSSHTSGSSSTYDGYNNYLTADEKKCLADKYGRHYDWAAAMDIDTKIAGWHLPTNADWDALANALGGSGGAGDKMKVGGSSGFNALFAGSQGSDGSSDYMGRKAYFWSSTPLGPGYAWGRYLTSSNGVLVSYSDGASNRFSVRLLKD